jgi:hypothetical protein
VGGDRGGGGGKYTTNGIKSKSSWPNRRREGRRDGWRDGWREGRRDGRRSLRLRLRLRLRHRYTDTDTHKSKEWKQQLEHHNNIIHTCMQA